MFKTYHNHDGINFILNEGVGDLGVGLMISKEVLGMPASPL